MAKIIAIKAPEPQRAELPEVYRLQSIKHQRVEASSTYFDATIINHPHDFRVHWTGQESNKLRVGNLVRIAWDGWPIDDDGTLSIGSLIPVVEPDPRLNIFQTVPLGWVQDQVLIGKGADYWEQLNPGLRHLFNAIFWDQSRFYNYLLGPSSRDHHHSRRNGNFAHCLEVAEIALQLAEHTELADPQVLVMAALLHDAAKAEEYLLDAGGSHQSWSEEGSLMGHRLMVFGWIKAAMASYKIEVPPRQLLALEHALLATEGIASWTGFPTPRMPEAKILAAADGVSGSMDLFKTLAPEDGGFGRRHWSMKYAPYFS